MLNHLQEELHKILLLLYILLVIQVVFFISLLSMERKILTLVEEGANTIKPASTAPSYMFMLKDENPYLFSILKKE